MDFEFETTRTALANAFATAGAELLAYQPLVSTAFADIPDTQPQKYAVAGTLKGILSMAGKMMGEDGSTGLEGLPRYEPTIETAYGGVDVASMLESIDGNYFDAADVERLLAAPATGEAVAQVGCEGDDGLLRVHAESETCDVCAPLAAAEKPTGDLTDEQIIEIADKTRTAESRDGDYILPISFARAIERAAIAAYLARQPKAEQMDAAVLLKTLESLTLSMDGRDQDQPGWHHRSGWNDALRRVMDVVRATAQATVAPAGAQNAQQVLEAMIAETDLTYKKGILHDAIRRIKGEGSAGAQNAEAIRNQAYGKCIEIAESELSNTNALASIPPQSAAAFSIINRIRFLQTGSANTQEGGGNA